MENILQCSSTLGCRAMHGVFEYAVTSLNPLKVQAWLLDRGYFYIRGQEREANAYWYSETRIAVAFSNGHRTVDVMLSKTEAAFAPIFKFHCTTVMNFIGGHIIFCAYQSLTLNYLARANPAIAYCRGMGMDTMDALRKYGLRGFHYLRWPENARVAPDAPYRTRSVTDRFCMWVDTLNVPSMSISYQELWKKIRCDGCRVAPGGYNGRLPCIRTS